MSEGAAPALPQHYGNLVANAESYAFGVTGYTYDLGDRLTALTPPAGQAAAATYTLDALGRIGSRTIGGTTDTYAYLGTTETVSRITTGGANTDALLGADGSRYATKTASGFGWLLADLHGNVAGASSSTLGTISDALRYDAYGQVTASVTSSLPTPWRYQGRLLVDPSGANDLYDAGARFYSPGLGVFTQLDTVQGSALDPLSLNRYLYAEADPETLVDPDGHASDDPFALLNAFAGFGVGVGETGLGFVGGIVSFGGQVKDAGLCVANPLCWGSAANSVGSAAHEVDTWAGDFAAHPADRVKGAVATVAFAAADWVGQKQAALTNPDAFEAGREAGHIMAGTEIVGLTAIYGAKSLPALGSAARAAPAALKAVPQGLRTGETIVTGLASETAGVIRTQGWGGYRAGFELARPTSTG